MIHYLVTGGAGFIGSNIVRELVACSEPVRVLDNFSTGRRENLADVLADIELIGQGAIPSVQRSVDDPFISNDANVNGTLNLLIAARDAGVRRVVYASFSSVYGDSPWGCETLAGRHSPGTRANELYRGRGF